MGGLVATEHIGYGFCDAETSGPVFEVEAAGSEVWEGKSNVEGVVEAEIEEGGGGVGCGCPGETGVLEVRGEPGGELSLEGGGLSEGFFVVGG